MGNPDIADRLIDCFRNLDETRFDRMLTDTTRVVVNSRVIEKEKRGSIIMNHLRHYLRNADSHEILVKKELDFPYMENKLLQTMADIAAYAHCGEKLSVYSANINVLYTIEEILSIHILDNKILSKEHAIQSTAKGTIFRREENICYIESCRNYTLWHCIDGVYKEKATLKNRARSLSDSFVKVGISHYINIFYIDKIHAGEIYLFTKEKIRIPNGKITDIADQIRKRKQIIS